MARCCSGCPGDHRGGGGVVGRCLTRSGACDVLRGRRGGRRRLRRLRVTVERARMSAGFCVSCGVEWEKRGGPGEVAVDEDGSVLCACGVVSMPIVASSGGADASWSGRCRGVLGPGLARSGSMK